jgi:pimeloyl-ACP methyl ester carboxylesterase
MTEAPQTRFVRNGDVHLAYQIVGSGPIDLLLIDTWVHHVDLVWDIPDFARLLRRLSSFARLIQFDRRGTGLSDPVPVDALPDLETQVEDAELFLYPGDQHYFADSSLPSYDADASALLTRRVLEILARV